MKFQYFTDEEYNRAFVEFGGIRRKIADLLKKEVRGKTDFIMDVPAGHGFLGAELALSFPESKVLAVGLPNDVVTHSSLRKSNIYPQDLWNQIQYIVTDATKIPLRDRSCDIVANFLGLEDIMMTRDMAGVESILYDMSRIVSNDGLVEISIVEYGDSPEERIAKEIWESIGLNCVFLNRDWYLNRFVESSLNLSTEEVFTFPKKMTAKQAKEELEFACENTPKTFSSFGVKAISFSELWKQFSKRIEKHGMAFWSTIRVMILKRL